MVASREMIRPSVFGQAIIITVYLPILALTGVEGKMFHPMAMTVIFALAAAFVLSLTFVPAMVALCIRGRASEGKRPGANCEVGVSARRHARAAPAVSYRAPGDCGLYRLLFLFGGSQEFVPTLDEHDIAHARHAHPSTGPTQSTKMQLQVENDTHVSRSGLRLLENWHR